MDVGPQWGAASPGLNRRSSWSRPPEWAASSSSRLTMRTGHLAPVGQFAVNQPLDGLVLIARQFRDVGEVAVTGGSDGGRDTRAS